MTGHFEEIGLGETALAEEKQSGRCEEQFGELVSRQSRFVFRLAYLVLRNSQDAEDVVQEVFLKLYRSGRWDKIKDERAYVSRVAWRISIDRLPNKRERTVPACDGLSADPPAPGETPEEIAVHANWSGVVHRLIDALPEELRLPLALSAGDELTSGEIAKLLRIPEGTVRTRMMKARALLKEKLSMLMGERHGR